MSAYQAVRTGICLLVLCIAAAVCAGSGQPSEKTYRILKIDSNAAGDPFSDSLDRGFKEYLNKKGMMIHYEEYEIGVRYHRDNKPSIADVAAIRSKLRSNRYNLILLSNNAAADLFLDGEIPVSPRIPILISSYHGPLEAKLRGKNSITGIITKSLWFQNTIFATRLLPGVRAFVLIMEAGADGKAQVQEYQKMLAENKFLMNIPITLISGQEYSTAEMLNKVHALPPNTVVLFQSWSSIKDKKPGNVNRILPQLRELFPGLIIGKYESCIQSGSSGGVTNSGYLQGLQAGKMAFQLLTGTPVSVLPVQQGPIRTLLLYDTVRKFRIPISSIPAGTELISSPPSMFERYRMEWIFGSLFCILFLALYIAALQYRRRQARRMEEMLLTALEMAEMVHFRSDLTGRITLPIRNSHFWPMQNGKSVPVEMWLFPEYVEEYRAAWQKLIRGETDSISLMYAAGAPEQKYYFEMRLRKIRNASGNYEFFGIVQDITDNRQNEMRCRDNVKLLDTLIDNLPGYLFVKKINDNFRYMLANNRFAEMLGIPKDRIIDHFDEEIFSHTPLLARKYNDDDRALAKSDTPLELRETMVDKQGRKYVVQTMKNTLTLSDGSHLLLGIGIDITKQYELEEKQKETILRLDAAAQGERIVNESLTRIMTAPDLPTAIADMLEIIGKNSGADRCYIFRYTDDNLSRASSEYEWVNDGIKPSRETMQDVPMPDIPAWREQIQSETAIVISDIEELPKNYFEETRLLRSQDVRSLLVAGIRLNGAIYGFVGVDFVRERKNFSDSDINMVYSIAKLFQLARERFQQLSRIADSVAIQRQIFDHVPSPVILCDPDCNIIAANPHALKNIGKTEQMVIGHKCYGVFCKNSAPPEWCPMKRAIEKGAEIQTEHTMQDRQYLITTRPIYDSSGKMIHILEIASDITEVTRQREQLRIAMEKVQAADRAKSCFLASISHELRTPLNSIIGFSELIQNEKTSPAEQADYVHSIQTAGCTLLNLINDILDLTKLEADRIEITPLKTDISYLLREATAIFNLKAKRKKLELTVSCNALPLLYVDTMRLRQILVNLIGNGVKFTQTGSVRVTARFTPANQETGELVVEIADTGIGIPQEQLDTLFLPFAPKDPVRGQRSYNGTGLGLSISKRLAAKMGGSIGVVSTEGKGSTFTLFLPGVRYEKQKTLPAAAISGREERHIRVLIIDDVPLNLKVLQAMLKKAGGECLAFSSAKNALKHLKNDSAFDAVLTDLWMPEMDGTEFAAAMKAEPAFAHIPIFAVTADLECTGNFDLSLFSGKLTKPVSAVALFSLLASIS